MCSLLAILKDLLSKNLNAIIQCLKLTTGLRIKIIFHR